LTVIIAHSLSSIGFSKSGYRKHKAANRGSWKGVKLFRKP